MGMQRARDDNAKMRAARRNERKDTERETIAAIVVWLEKRVASLRQHGRHEAADSEETTIELLKHGIWRSYLPQDPAR
jgi:hypothetical protein